MRAPEGFDIIERFVITSEGDFICLKNIDNTLLYYDLKVKFNEIVVKQAIRTHESLRQSNTNINNKKYHDHFFKLSNYDYDELWNKCQNSNDKNTFEKIKWNENQEKKKETIWNLKKKYY